MSCPEDFHSPATSYLFSHSSTGNSLGSGQADSEFDAASEVDAEASAARLTSRAIPSWTKDYSQIDEYRTGHGNDSPENLPREATSSLCAICLRFEGWYLRPLRPSGKRLPSFEFSHYPGWTDLKQSALGGCELCLVFRNGCLHSQQRRLSAPRETTDRRLQGAKNLVIRSTADTVINKAQWKTQIFNWSLVTYCSKDGEDGEHAEVEADFLVGHDDSEF